jgi:hypothetical protein
MRDRQQPLNMCATGDGRGRHRRPSRLLVVGAVVLLGGGVACAKGATEAKAPTGANAPPAENQDGHTTDAGPASGGAICSFRNLGGVTPEEVAQCLYGKWRSNDNSLTHIVADQTVVTSFFAHPWSSPDGSFTGCGDAPPGAAGGGIVHCTFAYHGGTIDMTLDGGPVTAVAISAPGGK